MFLVDTAPITVYHGQVWLCECLFHAGTPAKQYCNAHYKEINNEIQIQST